MENLIREIRRNLLPLVVIFSFVLWFAIYLSTHKVYRFDYNKSITIIDTLSENPYYSTNARGGSPQIELKLVSYPVVTFLTNEPSSGDEFTHDAVKGSVVKIGLAAESKQFLNKKHYHIPFYTLEYNGTQYLDPEYSYKELVSDTFWMSIFLYVVSVGLFIWILFDIRGLINKMRAA
jgi:hypothetical protein